ncbi:TniQ family protein [Herbaspirillum huttiense]|uniref:TniQ family protein n=1 Tax=Herbaspirillum huttiense TaxID=863372 RepID=UPI0039B0CA64
MLSFDVPEVEDELYYSWFIALFKRSGYRSVKEFQKMLRGHRTLALLSQAMHPAELFGLQQYSQRDYSPEKIASLTIFPYFRPFISEWGREKFVDQWNDVSQRDRGYLSTSSFMADGVKYCHGCRQLDFLDSGRYVWRRSHQLPGVFVCEQHGQPLCVIKEYATKCEIALEALAMKGEQIVDDVSDDLIWLAQKSKELLDLAQPFYSDRVLKALYGDGFDQLIPYKRVTGWTEFWSEKTLLLLLRQYGALGATHPDHPRRNPIRGKILKIGDSSRPLMFLLDAKGYCEDLESHFKVCRLFEESTSQKQSAN